MIKLTFRQRRNIPRGRAAGMGKFAERIDKKLYPENYQWMGNGTVQFFFVRLLPSQRSTLVNLAYKLGWELSAHKWNREEIV